MDDQANGVDGSETLVGTVMPVSGRGLAARSLMLVAKLPSIGALAARTPGVGMRSKHRRGRE